MDLNLSMDIHENRSGVSELSHVVTVETASATTIEPTIAPTHEPTLEFTVEPTEEPVPPPLPRTAFGAAQVRALTMILLFFINFLLIGLTRY